MKKAVIKKVQCDFFPFSFLFLILHLSPCVSLKDFAAIQRYEERAAKVVFFYSKYSSFHLTECIQFSIISSVTQYMFCVGLFAGYMMFTLIFMAAPFPQMEMFQMSCALFHINTVRTDSLCSF